MLTVHRVAKSDALQTNCKRLQGAADAGVGRADDLLYFKCPTTKQVRCPVNAYDTFIDIGRKPTDILNCSS